MIATVPVRFALLINLTSRELRDHTICESNCKERASVRQCDDLTPSLRDASDTTTLIEPRDRALFDGQAGVVPPEGMSCRLNASR
jgi:hypothetical protein